MIKLEKLEKGEFFEDAFLVSYRYNKDYLNKMRSLKYKRYVPDKKAWEIPSSELKHLVDLFGVDDINVNAKYLEGLVEKEESKAEEAPEDIKERLKDIKPIVDYSFKTKPVYKEALKGYNPAYIVGAVDPEDRQKEVDRFQNDPTCKVAIGTIGAMGTGLTMTAASYVFFVDKRYWDAENKQAEDRAHRIGTTNTVNVVSLVATNTVDEGIEEMLRDNKALFDRVVEGKGSRIDVGEILRKILQY